jgi:hypothetical protein
MKITLDLPEIEGYEYTGEFRRAKDREPYMTSGGEVESCIGGSNSQYPILKKKAPKYKLLSHKQSIRHDDVTEYVEMQALTDAMTLLDARGLTTSMPSDQYSVYIELLKLIS